MLMHKPIKRRLTNFLFQEAKKKNSKSNFRKHPITGKKVIETTFYYLDLGLFFRKYDFDTTKLSVGIKLYSNTIDKEEKVHGLPGRAFSGQLYIAENFINDKRQIAELQKLNNCTVTVDEAVIGSYRTIIGGDIIYKQNIIRLTFDRQTKELTSVIIHHNFKDR